jgi:hypothetical protein
MRLRSKCLGIILALACLQAAVAQMPDSLWLCKDVIPDTEMYYFHIYMSDTFPDNRGLFPMVDTGDRYDSMYINFDYQFSLNSVYERGDTTGGKPDTVFQFAPRPGYAGFKIFWDHGVVSFDATDYDSMYLWHKGPLPGHKVHLIWAHGGLCGTTITYQDFGWFESSPVWKRESFPFPPGFLKVGLFELRMLIYNDSIGGDTGSTSAPGNLKIDNICFFKLPPHPPVIQTQPQSQTVDEGRSVIFKVFAYGGAAGAPTYQWQKDGNPISGADSSFYTIASAKLSDAGSFTVVVTNSMGSVTSDATILTVKAKEEKKGCGCGSGTGLALIPPLFFKAMVHRKRKKKNLRT